jgi:hypothetical protein
MLSTNISHFPHFSGPFLHLPIRADPSNGGWYEIEKIRIFFIFSFSNICKVLDANSNAGFSLPDSILRELEQFEPSEKKRAMSSSSSSSSSSSLEEDDQSETEKINHHGHSSFPSLLSILSGLGQQFPQNQCFCCKAFVCRRQVNNQEVY